MRSRRTLRGWILGSVLVGLALLGAKCPGLLPGALVQLHNAGVDKYLGQFAPIASTPIGDGWVRHDFDPEGGDGPVCIAGTPYSVYSRAGDPSKLLILEQGGGACWQDFYNCNVVLENNPLPPFPQVDQAGLWNRNNPGNPFADYSVVYLPYCDGSVFSGDNEVDDAHFPFGPVRYHRGLRNQTAGMDLARDLFPKAKTITLAGSSAGGVGVAGFAPFLARFEYGNFVELTVFNDAGPIAINLNDVAGITARANDWQFGQFYPASCTACSDQGQATATVAWRLEHDGSIREAFYETDGDLTNRFFLGLLANQPAYRNLIVTEHGALNAIAPNRYKRFIVSGDTTHTALQSPLFYTQNANGVLLSDWANDFVDGAPGWVDIVEAP